VNLGARNWNPGIESLERSERVTRGSASPLRWTPGEIRQLRQLAAADGRGVAGYTARRIEQNLDRPSRRPRVSVRAKSRDERVRLRIAAVLP
jgi:hypothetical protein